MTTFTVIGTGSMGTAITGVLQRGGAAVTAIAHSDFGTKPVDGDMVVLALPYLALAEVVSAYGSQLAGRIVVDITNPLDFSTFDALVVPSDSSAAAELQQQLPEAKVLKAFNTNFAATLASGHVGDQPTTVLIAGDDAQAKQTLAQAVAAGGLRAVDAGSLKRARELEAVGFLQLTLAAGERIGWTGGFALEH